jgi:hypothetical protein
MPDKKPTRESQLKKDLADALKRLGQAQKRVADLERENSGLRRRLRDEQERPILPPPYPEAPRPWEPRRDAPWVSPYPTRPYYGDPPFPTHYTVTCETSPTYRPLSRRGRHY